MQTPEIRSQVRPALSHSLFVVYERGEAPGYDVSYDSWLAQPAMNPTTTRAKARVFMGFPSCGWMVVAIAAPLSAPSRPPHT